MRGMNRIRHAYREMVPGLEPYFVSGFHDDARGVLATYGEITQSASVVRNVLHGLTTTIAMVAIIDLILLGAVLAIIAIGLGAGLEVALPLAALGFLLGFILFAVIGMRTTVGQQARAESRFPSPPEH